jgi:hypothetical protein
VNVMNLTRAGRICAAAAGGASALAGALAALCVVGCAHAGLGGCAGMARRQQCARMRVEVCDARKSALTSTDVEVLECAL